MKTRSMIGRWHLGMALVFAAIVLAACGSGSTAKPAAQKTASGGTAAVTVMVKSGPLGDYLTDGNGRTLYLFANDTGTSSTCTGTCAVYWPPLTGPAQAGSGATASMLGTTARDDGTKQVTYNGHPLYYYKADTAAGQATGQGLNLNGGLWWVVSPKGAAITGAAPSPS